MGRKWLVWEKNWLYNHGWAIERADLERYGEMPVEYITGRAAWLDGEVGVNEETLIPRVETEELVGFVIGEIEKSRISSSLISTQLDFISGDNNYFDPQLATASNERLQPHSTGDKCGSRNNCFIIRPDISIAEIGTGSGVIAIGLASELKKRRIKAEIIAADINAKALAKARENAQEWGVKQNEIVFVESDLMSGFPEGKKFDLIVANLPYIPGERINNLEASVRDFEPRVALDGGADGAELITKCLGQIEGHLAPSGRAWMEVDETHDNGIIEKYGLHRQWEIEVMKDSHGRTRFWRIAKPLFS